MECKSCGHINAENINFCVNCGANLTIENRVESSNIVEDKSGLSKVSMILGIISAVFGVVCCFGYISMVFSIVCGILAIIFSIMSWKSSKQSYSIAGLVCGIIGLILGLIILIIILNEKALMEYLKSISEGNPYGTLIKAIL